MKQKVCISVCEWGNWKLLHARHVTANNEPPLKVRIWLAHKMGQIPKADSWKCPLKLLLHPKECHDFEMWHSVNIPRMEAARRYIRRVATILPDWTAMAYQGGGGLGCSNPLPEIPKISVESSIAWARRTGVSISFCSSLCSHRVVIY